MSLRIPWHHRMEARVAAGVVLLVTLSLAAVVATATRVATRSAVARASDNLEDARSAFYRLVDERASFAAQQTRLIIALPIFRSVMTTPLIAEDMATLTQIADGYRQELGAQFVIITDPEGNPTAMPGWTGRAALPSSLLAAIRGAATGGSQRDIVTVEGKLFLVTSEPARFAETELLGTVTFGFPLDDRVAHTLAQITRADVNLVSGGALAGSSLSGPAQQQMAAALAAGSLTEIRGVSSELRRIGDRQFVEGTFPLLRDHRATDVGHLVLLQDWAPTQVFLNELQTALLLTGVGGFVLALAGGLVFSRRTSRPLMDMAAAAQGIADGDWNRIVAARGSTETTILAKAFNDMTQSLRDQAAHLKASAQRFSTVTQSARDAIVSTDGEGHITFWNRSAEAMFGYAEQEVLGKPVAMLLAESDRAAYHAALPTPDADDLQFGRIIEVTALRRQGQGGTFPGELSLAALRGSGGITFTAVIRDVTERKQSQDALRLREEQLHEARRMEAVGRLAGGVARDFNNVLMAIQGYAELVVGSLSKGDTRRSNAEQIVKAADRAGSLTQQLLELSRRQVVAQQAVALDQCIEGMRHTLERLVGPKIRIVTEIWPDLTPVLADSSQMEQILVNLVVHARDSMPGGGKLTIGLRDLELDKIGVAAHPGLASGGYVELAIGDTGAGMDAETASRIFEPFFTTKGDVTGTGLGLATVYAIVHQNNGAIEVQSRLGHGTTFYVYLPRATDLGKPAPIRSTAGTETILLVEDDDRVRALVANMLKQLGYKVLLASATDQALQISAVHQGHIHLVLTDVVMPGLSGRVLAERLAATLPHTPVLYMSEEADHEVLRRGVRKASACFIQKPFSIDALGHKVRETLSTAAHISTVG